MMTRSRLSWAAVLWVASCSYCYSDTTYASTNNAAQQGLRWVMTNILPDFSQPFMTVEINGLTYQYTMVKEKDDDAVVTMSNDDLANPGQKIFENEDDWSQLHGGTIRKFFRFGYTNANRWGEGSLEIEGEGSIEDPYVIYNYKMVIDETLEKCYLTPLADPICPGYDDALTEYISNLEAPEVDDPFYDEWVQANLADEAEKPEEEEIEEVEEEKEEESLEEQLGAEQTLEAMDDTSEQASILAELAQVPKLNQYYATSLQGGVYEETLVLPSTDYPDNRRALRNLASDANHRTMVRSQYEQ